MPAKISNPKISSSSARREVDYTRIACELTTRLQDKEEALLAEKAKLHRNRADRRGVSDASLCRIGRIGHGWQNEGSDRRGRVIFFSRPQSESSDGSLEEARSMTNAERRWDLPHKARYPRDKDTQR
jgi:hypothetical protein